MRGPARVRIALVTIREMRTMPPRIKTRRPGVRARTSTRLGRISSFTSRYVHGRTVFLGRGAAMRVRMIAAGLTALAVVGWGGCATMPEVTLPFAGRYLRETVSPNPLVVPAGDFELVWKQSVRVL